MSLWRRLFPKRDAPSPDEGGFYVPPRWQELCYAGGPPTGPGSSAFCARPRGHEGPHRGMGVNTGKEWTEVYP